MRQVIELEQLLRTLVSEHRKLLVHLEAQHAALRSFNVKRIEDATNLAEATRLRIATLDTRRRTQSQLIGRQLRVSEELTLTRLAELVPARAAELTQLRDELRAAITLVQTRGTIASRVAGAVLGHLNTAVRLLAGAVEQAGVYTKHGTPKVAHRIGAMDAVG